MYKKRVVLGYYNRTDLHGDKFLLSSFRKAVKSIKKQIPVFKGININMKNLVGGAKKFKVNTKIKALTAELSLTPEGAEILKLHGIARFTGMILKSHKIKEINVIDEFQMTEILLLHENFDVYQTEKITKQIQKLLTNARKYNN